jgi:hypothetical protein
LVSLPGFIRRRDWYFRQFGIFGSLWAEITNVSMGRDDLADIHFRQKYSQAHACACTTTPATDDSITAMRRLILAFSLLAGLGAAGAITYPRPLTPARPTSAEETPRWVISFSLSR